MKQVALLMVISLACAVAAAQSTPSISLGIAIPKDHIPVGQKPWVWLTVRNLTNAEISYPDDRVYVQGESGEPPATSWGRLHKNGQLMPGPGVPPSIQPGDSFTMKYDLSAFYDLSKPGKYTVYIEVLHSRFTGWKGVSTRSPIAHFEIIAPSEYKCFTRAFSDRRAKYSSKCQAADSEHRRVRAQAPKAYGSDTSGFVALSVLDLRR